MAVNYSVPEILDVLRGDDADLVSDAFGRFPIISKLLVESDAVDSKLTDKFAAMVPDYVNARKANKTLIENLYSSGDTDDNSDTEDDEQAAKPAEEVRPEKKAREKKAEPEPEQEDDDEEEETEEVDYNSMKAMDLYKLCQKRGIEAEPKHRTKYYITLLEKADHEDDAPAESESSDDDDDWDI